jgi:hypothetical protein
VSTFGTTRATGGSGGAWLMIEVGTLRVASTERLATWTMLSRIRGLIVVHIRLDARA